MLLPSPSTYQSVAIVTLSQAFKPPTLFLTTNSAALSVSDDRAGSLKPNQTLSFVLAAISMRFFASASAILAIATSALAQTADFDPVYTPKKGEVVPAGSTYEVTWSAPAKYKDGKISISLIGGADPNSLVPLSDIASQ